MTILYTLIWVELVQQMCCGVFESTRTGLAEGSHSLFERGAHVIDIVRHTSYLIYTVQYINATSLCV